MYFRTIVFHDPMKPPLSPTTACLRGLCIALTTILALFPLLPLAAHAANDAAEFYRGKRLTYLVPTKPGGGYDTYARLIAKHLPKYLPVRAVQVRNVPGASHLIGLRQLDAAPADGLTLGTFNTGLIYAQIKGLEGMDVDLRRLGWVGKASSDPKVLVVGRQAGLPGIESMRKPSRDLHVASSGKASAASIEMNLIARALALKVKPVYGFAGTEAELAIMRGDVDGMVGTYSSLRGFIEQGHGRILLKVGNAPAELSAVADLAALVTDATGRRIAQLIAAQSSLGRLTATPANVPADRLAVLRDAYRRTLDDAELRREAATMKLPIVAMGGEEVSRLILSLLADQDALAPLLADLALSD